MAEDNMIIKGKAVVVGDDITSDIIIAEKYVEIEDRKVLGDRCFESLSEDFSPYFPEDGIIVAGKNFGKGSARDYPVIAIQNMGAKAVVAESFSKAFIRNASNLGLLTVECPGCAKAIKYKDVISIDVKNCAITVENRKKVLKTEPVMTQKLRDKLLFRVDEEAQETNRLEATEEGAETKVKETREMSSGKSETAAETARETDSSQEAALEKYLFEGSWGYDDIMLEFKRLGVKSQRQQERERIAKEQEDQKQEEEEEKGQKKP